MLALVVMKSLMKLTSPLFFCVMLFSLVGCHKKVPKFKKPHPIRRVEIIAHPSANQGVPMIFHWCFVLTPVAQQALCSLTPEQFFATRQELQRSYPKELICTKTTVLPDQNIVIDLPAHPSNVGVYLYIHFVEEGVKRWTVLPRRRIRVEVQGSDVHITTRETQKQKRKSKL